MFDHRPSPWESLPEVVIPEMNGGRVNIALPPGLYMSFQSILVQMLSNENVVNVFFWLL